MKRPTLSHRLEYAGFRLVSGIARLLPEPVALGVGEALGWTAGTIFRVRRRDVDRNLERAFPDRSPAFRAGIARRCYRHVGREGLAVFRLGGESAEGIRSRTEVLGMEVLADALRQGRGVILVAGHLGNWELAGGALAARGIPLDVVVQRQRNPLFDRDLVRTRERLGMGVIPRGEAVRRGLRSLREGRALALVADQNVRNGGVFVDFFGVPASTPRGPALLAFRSGAPVVFVGVRRLPGWSGRYVVSLEAVPVERGPDPEEEVRRVTAAHTRLLEQYIQAAPEQYFWPHRRWKTRPSEPTSGPNV